MTDEREPLLDELLVLRCQEGSRAAFGALVERWQEPLWRHAYRLTGRSDVAWDVLQDAWISVAKGIARLQDPAGFRSWVYTIVTRRASDTRRRERPTADLDELPETPARDADDGSHEALRALRDGMRELDARERVLLTLHHVEGFRLAEIARILDVPEGTVKSRLHEARRKLRKTLERNER